MVACLRYLSYSIAYSYLKKSNLTEFPSYFFHPNPYHLIKLTLKKGVEFPINGGRTVFICRFNRDIGFDTHEGILVDTVSVYVDPRTHRVSSAYPEFYFKRYSLPL